MRLAIKILFIISLLITLFLLSEIWEPLPITTSAYSNIVKLKKDVTIDFEVQLDGCYKIELIPLYGSILGNDFKIKTKLNPKTESQVINSEIDIKDGNFQLGLFCAGSGDDFELKININDERLINKNVRLLIDANDAMPSQNLYWATELRPFIQKMFYLFLGITLIFGIILIFVKRKST